MRCFPAILATGLAMLIFWVMAMLVAWGWSRGYSEDGLYLRSLLSLAGFAVPVFANLVMLVAAWRRRPVASWVIGIVFLTVGLAVFGAVWNLVFDPGDAFWVVPPLAGYAVCSVWSVLVAWKMRGV